MTDQAIRDLKNDILTSINDVLAAEPENWSIARGTIDGQDFYKVERPIGVVEMGTTTEPQPSQGWQDIATCPPVGLFLLSHVGSASVVVVGWRDSAKEHGFDTAGQIYGVWFKPTHWQPLPLPPSPPLGAE